MKNKQKKAKARATMKSYDGRIAECEENLRMKTLIDFDHSVACSINSLAVEKATDIKLT